VPKLRSFKLYFFQNIAYHRPIIFLIVKFFYDSDRVSLNHNVSKSHFLCECYCLKARNCCRSGWISNVDNREKIKRRKEEGYLITPSNPGKEELKSP
ncbi:hypothetical protein ES288_D01G131400v1, partial [Gossypium darwinii]